MILSNPCLLVRPRTLFKGFRKRRVEWLRLSVPFPRMAGFSGRKYRTAIAHITIWEVICKDPWKRNQTPASLKEYHSFLLRTMRPSRPWTKRSPISLGMKVLMRMISSVRFKPTDPMNRIATRLRDLNGNQRCRS